MTTGDGRVLRLERRLPVPQATVYDALTEADQLGQWWGPRGFTTPSVDFDPRVGDRYRIAMQPPDGDLFNLLGEFRKVDPPAGLTFTFRWEPPHPDDRETLVTLSLLDLGDETEIRLTQGEFATEERYTLHEAGWTESFDRLDEFLRNAT
jgi:uncharacterized protein YndB with AHSA1/START domain